ncbi:MAG: peptidoglycan bridge formation glycyltransferase FemA/FemB family protein [Patescibacteria group bacterium]|nr:peptidoglycan bridge formation glycyltransferase FemA/FemB family protein [Patescibacteria group bacterium]
MDLRLITSKQKKEYNQHIAHVMQSWEWGEVRQSLGAPLQRYGLYKNGQLVHAFQLTFHRIPYTNSTVGYLPKGPFPTLELAQALTQIGQEHHCAFIKIEPDIEVSSTENQQLQVASSFKTSPKPLFTKHNFVLDLTQSEEEILKQMHPKTRYNIKVAQKHGVIVEERTDDQAFQIYLKLYFETTKRQGYLGHNPTYHQKVWQTLKKAGMARILLAFYQQIPLNAWMMFNFKDTLYYPYGGSSVEYKNVMAPNLVAWEAIKMGKKMGLKKFDLWGALGPQASPKDPWQGFHRFKSGLGGKLVEYIGSFDLVFNKPLYLAFTSIDKAMPIKVFLLKLAGKI